MPGAAKAKVPRLSMTRDSECRWSSPQPHPEEPRAARRLEGWAAPRLYPTLRDAVLRTAPQGEAVCLHTSCRSRCRQPTQVGHGEVKGQQDGLRRLVGAMQMHRP